MSDRNKKRARTEEPAVAEPRCLLVAVSEDGSVYFYSVPSHLITPEVVDAVQEGGLGILFDCDCDDDVTDLPLCLQALIPEIRVENDTGEQASVFITKTFTRVLKIDLWN